uniref:DUF6868 family protein n=1 Tax=uncultured Roseovarius sp. TaxID=293344 RepID=UPI0025FCC529
AFFGWMTVLNLGFLILTTILLLAGRDKFAAIHASMLDMEPADVKKGYFTYLANYKTLILAFNVMPYFALKLI